MGSRIVFSLCVTPLSECFNLSEVNIILVSLGNVTLLAGRIYKGFGVLRGENRRDHPGISEASVR